MIYVTSDLHFGHDKEFVWRARGYNSVTEMNDDFVRKWNDTITEDDEVYLLGDLFLGDYSNIKYLDALNGKIHVIRGNHDTDNKAEAYCALPNIVEVTWATMIKYKKWHFFLSHYPCLTGNADDGKSAKDRVWSLCGHRHTSNPYEDMKKGIPSYHVEVDAHDGFPISLDYIIEDIKNHWNA